VDPDAVPLSIIVVNTSHCHLLRQCLGALGRAELPAGTEILVVDNASRDGSAELVEHQFPAAQLLRQDVRRGPAANYNRGFAAARGEFLLVLNEDTEVAPEAVITLYRYLKATPGAGLAAPRLVYPDGSPQQCCNRFPGFASAFKRLILQSVLRGPWVDDRYREEIDGVAFEPDWIMATSLMIRRAAMEQAGGAYDEQFEVYYEEIDLCRRLRSKGWRVVWMPDAVVTHHHGVSNFQLRGERDILFRLLLYQSRYRYFRKHHGAVFAGALRAVEASLFALFAVKTGLEALVPTRRRAASMKSRLYTALLRYAVRARGCPGVPQE
jgi:GT2 family glycosyltransferase